MQLAAPPFRDPVGAESYLFPNELLLKLPLPEGIHPDFMREAADVHRELFEEHAESYGENVRVKLERCLAVTEADYERAVAARERYRERLHESASEVDLLVSPTLVCVAPPVGQDELVLRD